NRLTNFTGKTAPFGTRNARWPNLMAGTLPRPSKGRSISRRTLSVARFAVNKPITAPAFIPGECRSGSRDLFRCHRRRCRITRVELRYSLLPHLHECGRRQVFDRFPDLFDSRKRVLPNGALAPLLAFLPAF